ncbi:hypothetical protein H7F28_23310 [Brevibacterium sp. PAMC23299]|nr:hypothetical protein H7F28_23310 [Brevibacterium sp. PAMC23299]
MIRQAGAKEVHIRISSPMVRNPCFYGVDMPTKEELFANKDKHEHERAMRKVIGADSLAFLNTEGLLEAVDVDLGEIRSPYITCLSWFLPN